MSRGRHPVVIDSVKSVWSHSSGILHLSIIIIWLTFSLFFTLLKENGWFLPQVLKLYFDSDICLRRFTFALFM